MPPRYEESEFVFCDLQNVFRYIRRDEEAAAKRRGVSLFCLLAMGMVMRP